MTIPANIRVPFMFLEVDSSRAFQGPSILEYNVLIMGQKTSAGIKPELGIDQITNKDQAEEYYGAGSQLARMFEKWFLNNKINSVFGIAIDDAAAGVAATGSITVTGNASADETLALFINGVIVNVAVSKDDTPTIIGDAIVAAIAAKTKLPVTGVNAIGVVTLTAKNKGTNGNGIDIQLNFYEGEVTPAGITVAIVGMASGATNPDVAEIIAVLGDNWYQIIDCPWNDTTNLVLLETEMADRYTGLRMIDGVAFIPKKGTLGELSSFGNGRNSPHVCCPNSHKVPQSPEEYVSAYCAQLALEGSADPARPFQTLPLYGITPPKEVDRFTVAENNILLFDGIATYQIDSGGVVRIQRAITMYQKNVQGAPDIAYLDVNTMLTLLYLRFDFKSKILTKYPRAKLANDGVTVAPNQQVITPKIGKAEAISIFKQWELLGLVENFAQFKNDLQCFRSQTDPNRLEWVLPPDLINQFRVGVGTLQFLLESPITI